MGEGKKMSIIDWIMKVPVLEVRPLFSKLFKIKRVYLAIILAVVAIPAILLSYGFVQMVGTQKVYCLNCHVNQRNVNFWRKPANHPDISCPSCHDVGKGQQGGTLHFSFSAKDDVVNTHCMGCHKKDLERMAGIDAGDSKRPANEQVRIPHSKHVMGLGIKCTYCHSNIFHDRRPAGYATYRPTMEACYSCHDEATTKCDMCHPKGLPTALPISGKVGGGRMTYNPKGAGEVVFNHARHVGKGLTCNTCHDKVFQMRHSHGAMTMARIYEGKDCGHCHNGKAAFASSECGKCHRGGVQGGGNIAFEGGGSGKVLFSHDRHMKMGLKCEQCHSSLFGYDRSGKMTMDMMNQGKACGACHNGKRAFAVDDCGKCHQMG